MQTAAKILLVFSVVSGSTAAADIRLVGNTFTHAWTVNTFPEGWPTPKYETRFCDQQTLVWNDVTDRNNVKSGMQNYELTELSPGVLQVTWKESPETTNQGVVWNLNFRTYGIHGVLVNLDPNANYVVAGGFSVRKSLHAQAPLRGCP